MTWKDSGNVREKDYKNQESAGTLWRLLSVAIGGTRVAVVIPGFNGKMVSAGADIS